MRLKKPLLFIAAISCGLSLAEEKTTDTDSFTWGGDIRLREVYFDKIPYNTGTEGRDGGNHFQRYRTRLWGDFQPTANLHLHARAVNEFRTYVTPDNKTMNAMDEIVFDHLYLDWTNQDWNLRIGRQDLIYGTGKVILEGTPKDGSRTIYFNAIKASYSGIQDTTIDFLAMYTPGEDELAIHSQDRDIVGESGTYYDGAEAGGGVYAKNHSIEHLPFEAYYLIKTEEDTVTSATTSITHNREDRHTFGTRLMPQISDSMSGNFEFAYQTGEDISAFMIDAEINQQLDEHSTLGLGWYYLSGDDASSSTDEGWNPLWARYPQYSELYVYSFDTEGAGRWSNISMPHIDLSISPAEKLNMDFMLGYMFAPEADSVSGGQNRGLLFTWWNKFTLAEKLFSEKDKLTGHVLLELMQPDDYYADTQEDDTVLFSRIELSYSF